MSQRIVTLSLTLTVSDTTDILDVVEEIVESGFFNYDIKECSLEYFHVMTEEQYNEIKKYMQ